MHVSFASHCHRERCSLRHRSNSPRGFKFSQLEMSTSLAVAAIFRGARLTTRPFDSRGCARHSAVELRVRVDRSRDHMELLGRHIPHHGGGKHEV